MYREILPKVWILIKFAMSMRLAGAIFLIQIEKTVIDFIAQIGDKNLTRKN